MNTIRCIRSGGQSGVDRAALDTALKKDIPICGWCPKDGWAEDFPTPPGITAFFPQLKETSTRKPKQRTIQNAIDSDATLVIRPDGIKSPGPRLAEETAKNYGKPCLRISGTWEISTVISWLKEIGHDIDLNVAGPRQSEWPKGYEVTAKLLSAVIDMVKD